MAAARRTVEHFTAGWVAIQHAQDIEGNRQRKREQQEERDRKARRLVPIQPAQPQPTGQTPLERTLDGLLGGG